MTVIAALGWLFIPILFIMWIVSTISDLRDSDTKIPEEWNLDEICNYIDESMKIKDKRERRKFERQYIENYYAQKNNGASKDDNK